MAAGLGVRPIPWVDREYVGVQARAWRSEAFIGVYTLRVDPMEKLRRMKRGGRYEFTGKFFWTAEDGGECCYVGGGTDVLYDTMAEAKAAAEAWFRKEIEQYLPYAVREGVGYAD